MRKRLEGKVAIVVGAGTEGEGIGNGKATAIQFAREGAKVLCVDLDESAAEITCKIGDLWKNPEKGKKGTSYAKGVNRIGVAVEIRS